MEPTSDVQALRALPQAAAAELTLEQQSGLLQALAAAWAAMGPGPPQRIETHLSVVLVRGGFAYKFKKALKTTFVDQSTLALRRHACAEELRLNRRLAPDLYLGVVPITGTVAQPHCDGDGGGGPLLEVAVKMRAFAQDGLWDRLADAGRLEPAHVDTLAATIARFHDAAATAGATGWRGRPQQVRGLVLDNLDELAGLWPDAGGRAALARLREHEGAEFQRLAPHMARRQAQGCVRECHGDLHLGNVVQREGGTTVFDGIEFKDELRWLDTFSDVAFMAMDLQAHGQPALAHRFVDAYLQHRGDYDGVRLLPYQMSYRALVRAKVALMRALQQSGAAGRERQAAERYLSLALAAAAPCRPALLITHGASGSGKTTLTQELVEAAGAVRIRADVERKRLAGLDAMARSDAGLRASLYSPAMTAATYARLLDLAAPVIEGGCHALLDATFLQHDQRATAARWAAERGVPFVVLDFVVDPTVLRRRVRQRAALGSDASEADEHVLEAQWRAAEPLRAEEAAAVFAVRARDQPQAAAPRADWAPLLQLLSLSRAGAADAE